MRTGGQGARLVALFLVAMGSAAAARAQEMPRLSVPVRQIAGTTLYVDAGRRQGIETGDTLAIQKGASGPLATVVATAVSETRAVLAFVGTPLSLDAGDPVTIALRRSPPPAVAEPPATVRRAPPPAVPKPRPHGRIAMEVSALRSETSFGGSDPIDEARRYATPVIALDLDAPGAVGAFDLRLGTRVAYRYADRPVATPSTSARLYAASLERSSTGHRLALSLGRFHSPDETFSGYWDGARARYGTAALGVGVIAGFEPDTWNERPSFSRPKQSLVVDGRARGKGWSWGGSVSGHRIRGGGLAPRDFLGVQQRLVLRSVRLTQDLTVDRDPTGGPWRPSRISLRGSVALAAGLDLAATYARDEAFLDWRPESPFDRERTRMGGGLSLRARGGWATLDVTRSTTAGVSSGTAYSAGFALPLTRALALEGSGSWWEGPFGTTGSASPGISWVAGGTRWHGAYRITASDYLDRAITTQAADLTGDFALGPRARFTLRAQTQWGRTLSSQLVELSLYRMF